MRAILHEMLDLIERTEQNQNMIDGLHLLIDSENVELGDMDFILSRGRKMTVEEITRDYRN